MGPVRITGKLYDSDVLVIEASGAILSMSLGEVPQSLRLLLDLRCGRYLTEIMLNGGKKNYPVNLHNYSQTSEARTPWGLTDLFKIAEARLIQLELSQSAAYPHTQRPVTEQA